jgi:lipopolysaccharide/colanic/teichoic acid biosynthesis glycosyltransferase
MGNDQYGMAGRTPVTQLVRSVDVGSLRQRLRTTSGVPGVVEQTRAPSAQDWGPSDAELDRLVAQLLQRRPTRYERLVKPAIDRAGAVGLMLVLSPVLLLAALTLLATLRRPVLIRQTRVGRGRRPFSMMKFRTMLPDRRVGAGGYTGAERRRTHKSVHDPRHTRVGRLMRKFSLDELPQLFNVLRGDMSLVGPRPELYEMISGYHEWQHSRHLIKPGLTGVWQTTERGRGRPLHECVDLDLRYIERLSLRHDLAILARTPAALLRTRGVI